MIGELAVLNFGTEPRKFWFRHASFPAAASRHESVPWTPSVATLPSDTVGEDRGPENPDAGPVTADASYLSCQTSLPVTASRHWIISLPPCRARTNSLSPTNAGVATPSPTGTFHLSASSLGQVPGTLKPTAFPSRFGPRHCGQSCAYALPDDTQARQQKNARAIPGKLLMANS